LAEWAGILFMGKADRMLRISHIETPPDEGGGEEMMCSRDNRK